MPQAQVLTDDILAALTGADLAAVQARDTWLKKARPKQLPPVGDWHTLLAITGRGWGKTETLSQITWWENYKYPLRWHALAPTIGDVRRVVFEGESGLMNTIPRELVKSYNRSIHEITLTNGSVIAGFGVVEEANRLRGPQCHGLTFDEAAAADRPAGNLEMAYKVASLGCRLPHPDGKTPARKYIATTPKPIQFLKNLMRQKGVVVVHGTTYENLANLASAFGDSLTAVEGTAFARQELHGEILDDMDGGIFKRNWFRLWPARNEKGALRKLPEFKYIVMSMDCAMSEENYDAKKDETDYSACAILGVFNVKQVFSEAEIRKLNVRSQYAALLLSFWMERLGFPELLEKAREQYRTKWGDPGRRPDIVLIEHAQSGISLRQFLMQYGVPTVPYPTRGQSKTMRAHAASPLVLQGMLFVPESMKPDRQGLPRDWAEPLLDQMCAFRGEGSVEHDDGLDAVVQAMLTLSEQNIFHAEPISRSLPDYDEAEAAKEALAKRQQEREQKGKENPYG